MYTVPQKIVSKSSARLASFSRDIRQKGTEMPWDTVVHVNLFVSCFWTRNTVLRANKSHIYTVVSAPDMTGSVFIPRLRSIFGTTQIAYL